MNTSIETRTRSAAYQIASLPYTDNRVTLKHGERCSVRLLNGSVVEAIYVRVAFANANVSHHVLRACKPLPWGDTMLVAVVGHRPLSQWECTFVDGGAV